MTELEAYFQQFRQHIIGVDQEFESAFGNQKIIYTDWTASGRLYRPIEDKLCNDFGPFVANTHTETTVSGTAMTMAYNKAKHIIKEHVNSNDDDVQSKLNSRAFHHIKIMNQQYTIYKVVGRIPQTNNLSTK